MKTMFVKNSAIEAWACELLQCPFCGGTPHFFESPDGGHCIECDGCHASSKLLYPDKTDPRPLLAEAWNQRVVACPECGRTEDHMHP